jgi:uncharacterized membrane protein HdeD (DUF308 family)
MVDVLTRNWGWVALRGVVALLFGVLMMLYPAITLVALVLMFGAYTLADGVFAVVTALRNRHGQRHRLALLVGGLLGIGIGVTAMLMPDITATAMLAVIAAWIVLTGIVEIAAAVRLRREISGEWILVLAGVMAVAFGTILVVAPRMGMLAVLLWIGAYTAASGVLLIVLALRLRHWGREHPGRGTLRPA